MIRTLTLVSVLALLAGLAMGFFFAAATPKGRTSPPPAVDRALERKVREYEERHALTPEETEEIRRALRQYDQEISDLLRKLRAAHNEKFLEAADKANKRIESVLKGR